MLLTLDGNVKGECDIIKESLQENVELLNQYLILFLYTLHAVFNFNKQLSSTVTQLQERSLQTIYWLVYYL